MSAEIRQERSGRFTAIISVVALVLSGIAVGGLGVELLHLRRGDPARERWRGPTEGGPPFGPPGGAFGSPPGPRRGPPPIAMLSRELDLDRDQARKLESLLEESHQRADALRRELRPRLDAEVDKTLQQIDALLNAEQKERLLQLQKRDRFRLDRMLLGDPPPPAPQAPPPPFPGGPPPG